MEKPKSSNQVWDCGSALYDSFELNSFQKQLDSAIVSSSRTFSMPRLPSTLPPPPQKTHAKAATKASKKISRTFQKVLRAVFRSSRNKNNETQQGGGDHGDHEKKRAFVVYEKPNGLSTIPENPEVEDGSKFVRKTVSDRFSAASVGRVYCA